MNSEPFTLLFSSYLSVFLVTTKSDRRHVIIFIFLYIGDVIYHYICNLLSSIIWIAISIHSKARRRPKDSWLERLQDCKKVRTASVAQ